MLIFYFIPNTTLQNKLKVTPLSCVLTLDVPPPPIPTPAGTLDEKPTHEPLIGYSSSVAAVSTVSLVYRACRRSALMIWAYYLL